MQPSYVQPQFFALAFTTCYVQQFIDFLIACWRVHFVCNKERWWPRQACKRSPQVFNHLTSHDQVSASGSHVSGFADDKELSLDTSASSPAVLTAVPAEQHMALIGLHCVRVCVLNQVVLLGRMQCCDCLIWH